VNPDPPGSALSLVGWILTQIQEGTKKLKKPSASREDIYIIKILKKFFSNWAVILALLVPRKSGSETSQEDYPDS
jgi:hypothetical protein